jgi:hypothetical protein
MDCPIPALGRLATCIRSANGWYSSPYGRSAVRLRRGCLRDVLSVCDDGRDRYSMPHGDFLATGHGTTSRSSGLWMGLYVSRRDELVSCHYSDCDSEVWGAVAAAFGVYEGGVRMWDGRWHTIYKYANIGQPASG